MSMGKGVLFLLLLSSCLALDWKIRETSPNDPVPNPKAVVTFGNARFTILTPQLVRMEYAPNKVFVDAASLVFINRNLPVPNFVSKSNGNVLVIDTGSLAIIYNQGIDQGKFGPSNLNITFSFVNKTVHWNPSSPATGNLNGTRVSLDCYTDSCQDGMPLDPGLLSLDGWVLFDDTATPLFNYSNPDGIPWITMPNQRNGGQSANSYDWYFLGYGWNFTQALYDYSLLSGPIAIPPASAFGSWWSRYYPYNQSGITTQIIDGYQENGLPLNHLVLDMDWHVEINDKQCNTWGGYTWNTDFFPVPQEFIDFVHAPPNNLRLLLNLHPNTGVDVCQAQYYALAKAIGFDTSQNQTIPCDFMDHLLATNMFSVVMDVVGNDYWWTDYNGCHTNEPISDDYDLLWSNHVYFYEMFVKNQRPLTLSRYGGPGNQRYPVGFSGDTYSVFPTLEFEIYFTLTSANILFGYWSHDTGGFHNEPSDELFLRWLQFATFEPIYRIHSDHQERRIWEFPSFEAMKQTMLWRNALGPYICNQARRSYDTAISLVHPVYYDFPNYTQSYSFQYQYMFGHDLLVAPIVTPLDPSTNTTTKTVWFPPGLWVDWGSNAAHVGPFQVTYPVQLATPPFVFVRAGAVIPMKTMQSVTDYTPDPLIFAFFPGKSTGTFTYYEDDGDTNDYINGAFSLTNISWSTVGPVTKYIVGPTTGTYSGQAPTRTYQLLVRGISNNPNSITFEGKPLNPAPDHNSTGWWIDPVWLGLVIQLPPQTLSNVTTVVLQI